MTSSGKHLTRRSASVLSLTARKFCKTLTFFLSGAAHLVVAVDDVGADHVRFEREELCHGSLRDFYYHGGAPVGFLLVASTGGGIF